MTSESSQSGDAKIDASGRVVIPAWMRRALNLRPNTALRVRIEDNQLILETREASYRRAKERMRPYLEEGRDDVNKLLRERQEDSHCC